MSNSIEYQTWRFIKSPEDKCDNKTSYVSFTDINKDSKNIISLGKPIEGNKYHCFTSDELKEIILAEKLKTKPNPTNPLTREPLPEDLIEKIKEMYPNDFREVIEPIEPEISFHTNVTIDNMKPVLLGLYKLSDINRNNKPLKKIIGDDKWNNWYENTPDKNAMVHLFKLISDIDGGNILAKEYAINMLYDDLEDLINRVHKDFRFHYVTLDNYVRHNMKKILGIAITYKVEPKTSKERLRKLHDRSILNFGGYPDWNTYKLCTITVDRLIRTHDLQAIRVGVENELISITDILTNELFLKKILEDDNKKKLVCLSFDFNHPIPNRRNYIDHILNNLHFYNIDSMSNKYNELYSTYDVDNKLMNYKKSNTPIPGQIMGGAKRISSKRRLLKKRSLKMRTSTRSSSKRSSSKRSSSKKRSLRRRMK